MELSDGSPLFHANFWSEPSDFTPIWVSNLAIFTPILTSGTVNTAWT